MESLTIVIVLVSVTLAAGDITWDVCGAELYNMETSDCCKLRVVPKEDGCSGTARCFRAGALDLSYQKCCVESRVIVNRTEQCPVGHFCNGVQYSPETEDCCANAVIDRSVGCSGNKTCRTQVYDASIQRCCKNRELKGREEFCSPGLLCNHGTSWINPASEQCCHETAYDIDYTCPQDACHLQREATEMDSDRAFVRRTCRNVGSLCDGNTVTVTGQVCADPDWVNVRLETDLGTALIVSHLFNYSDHVNKARANSYLETDENKGNVENYDTFSLSAGNDFAMTISLEGDMYKISVDGAELGDYPIRDDIPVSGINHVCVRQCATLNSVSVGGPST